MVELAKATIVRDFSVPAADVHAAWLSRQAANDWLARTLRRFGSKDEVGVISLDPRVGGGFVFSHVTGDVETAHWGRYQAIDAPHVIEFTWFSTPEQEEQNASFVRVEFTPAGAGCTARLVHWFDARHTDRTELVEKGWASLMEALEDHLTGESTPRRHAS